MNATAVMQLVQGIILMEQLVNFVQEQIYIGLSHIVSEPLLH